jgi:Fe-S cluster biogenesis protein NfuA
MAIQEQVQQVLTDQIAPRLQADGGNIELVEVTEDNIVKVKLVGACAGCPGAQMTLRMGVERLLKEAIPEVVGVEAV